MLRDLRWVSFAVSISRISSFVTIPLLTNALVPANYGLYRSVLLAGSTLLIINQLPNLGFLVKKRLPELEDTSSEGGLITAVLTVQLSLVLIAVGGLVLATVTGSISVVSEQLQNVIEQYLPLIIVLIIAQGMSQSLLPTIQGLERFRIYSVILLLRELSILLIIIGLFVMGQLNVLLAIATYVFAEIATTIFAAGALNTLLMNRPNFSHLCHQFIDISLPLIPRSVLKSAAGRIPDILILASFGEVVFGLWTIIFAFTNIFQLFSKPLSHMLIPKISNRLSKDMQLDRLTVKFYKTMILISSPLVLGGWLVGANLVQYVFGQGYAISPMTLGVFLFAFGLQTVDSLGGAMFVATGESSRETIRYGLSIVVRFTFVLLGTFVYQSLILIGLGYVLENAVRFLFSLRYQRKLITIPVPTPVEAARFIFVLGLMGTVVVFSAPYAHGKFSIMVVGLGATVYFASLFASGLLSPDDMKIIKEFIRA